MSKINDEDLISLITGNIDQQKSNSLMQIIKEDSDLRKRYEDLKEIRDTQYELMNDFIKSPMPDKTKSLFQPKPQSKLNNLFSLLRRGPIAGVGWAGFAVTGGLLAVTTGPLQLAFFEDSSQQFAGIVDQDTSKTKFRGLDNEILNKKDISIGDVLNMSLGDKVEYQIKVSSIEDKANEICIYFALINQEDSEEAPKKVCFQK